MSQKSPIEWTDRTSNPIRAFDPEGKRGWMCAHVSEGCRNCYAERINIRLGTGGAFTAANVARVKFELNELELGHLLKLLKPWRIFLCDMTDLFGEWVPFEWIDRIFVTMALCPQQTFQILTKRPARMLEYMNAPRACFQKQGTGWPLPNVWLGVSCEDQETADERIPLLLQTPAAVRWLSAEPLLGSIDLTQYLAWGKDKKGKRDPAAPYGTLDWVVAGGESGAGARPMHPDWVRSLRDQCVAASVPFFFKQWGAWIPAFHPGVKLPKNRRYSWAENPVGTPQLMARVGKRAGGRELGGCTWEQFPERTQT